MLFWNQTGIRGLPCHRRKCLSVYFRSWECRLCRCCRDLVINRFLEVLLLRFGIVMRGSLLNGREMSGFVDMIWTTSRVESEGTFLA